MTANKLSKVIFLGTPDFAVPSLRTLIQDPEIEVLAVITQPDKPVGRKQIITAPIIKTLAREHRIPVYQPESLNNDEELFTTMQKLNPDYLITVAYGQIIKEKILNFKPIINVHASLLPYYRGPAPINWMIINGETEVGVSTMLTNAGIDTGDILLQAKTTLDSDSNAQELSTRLASMGAELLIKTLKTYTTIQPIKQSSYTNLDSDKILAPFMNKELGYIDFKTEKLLLKSGNPKQRDFLLTKDNSATNIHNLVRACLPWPVAYFTQDNKKIQILETTIVNNDSHSSKIGEIIHSDKNDKSITIQCKQGQIKILRVKPESKAELSAYDWFNGLKTS